MLLIPMEMPKNCLDCPLQGGAADCRLTGKTYNWGLTTRPSDCPLIEVDRMNDKITLKDAIETHAWTMLYAAEPTRPVDVTMSYADLWAIFKWIKETVPESEGSDGNI